MGSRQAAALKSFSLRPMHGWRIHRFLMYAIMKGASVLIDLGLRVHAWRMHRFLMDAVKKAACAFRERRARLT